MPWDAARCGDDAVRNARMERHPDLAASTPDDLLSAHGTPATDERFAAGQGVGTYRGGIAAMLPGGAAKNADRPVRELVWTKARCNFVVRFVRTDDRWTYFDAFEASVDADF